MSRLRQEENEAEDDSIGHPYQRNVYRRGGPGPALGTSNKNAMQSLANELDELTRLLDSKVSLQDLVGGKGQSHERGTSRDLNSGNRTQQVPQQNSHHPQPSFGSLQFSSVASVSSTGDGGEVANPEESPRTQQNLNKYLQDEETPSRRGIDPPKAADYYSTRSSSRNYPEAASFATPAETINPRNTSYPSAANRTRDTDTSQLEPPANLQSPLFRLFSPPPVPTPYSDKDKKKPADARSRLFQTSGTTGKASSSNHPIDPPPSPVRPSSSWQPILEDMRQTLEEKDEQIRTLEEENEYLRSQLQRLKQVGETIQQRQSACEATPRTTPNREENHQQRRRRQQLTKNDGNDGIFSPGTKFVAELAQLVEIEVGHHGPLSYIMDKYWDKLAPYDEEE